jgi:anti-sigma regulatory factor (Ser/Thr protein kinase)
VQKAELAWRIRRGDFEGAARARREFALYLRAKHTGDAERYDATLIFGELVANAVKSARSSVTVELLENGWTALRIVDDGDCFEPSSIAPQPLFAQSGRGLYIVKQLARNLNVATINRRCEVTVELPVRS